MSPTHGHPHDNGQWASPATSNRASPSSTLTVRCAEAGSTRTRLHPPAMHAAPALPSSEDVLLQAIHRNPQAVPEVFGPACLDQLLRRDRRRRLALRAFAIAQREGGRGERACFVILQLQRLHAVDRCIDRLEVPEHAESTLDHLALDVAPMRNANIVRDVAHDETVAADLADHARKQLIAAGTVMASMRDLVSRSLCFTFMVAGVAYLAIGGRRP